MTAPGDGGTPLSVRGPGTGSTGRARDVALGTDRIRRPRHGTTVASRELWDIRRTTHVPAQVDHGRDLAPMAGPAVDSRRGPRTGVARPRQRRDSPLRGRTRSMG